MEKEKNLLLVLESKYGDSIPLLQILEDKYSFDETESEQAHSALEMQNEPQIILSNDICENEKFVNKLIDSADNLIKQLDLPKNDDIHAKLLAEYVKQLKKIPEKKLTNGEKLAASLCKCIKKTILKLFHIKNYGTEIIKYLQSNGFKLDSFESGHRLSDDDLCLLDENLLQAYKEITLDPDKNYKVIDMVQPIIRVFYLDEDDEEIYSHFLPGICKYYVKEAER